MNFRRAYPKEAPEINLIPMIDVLLVIIIFLMLTTTYSKFAGLEIDLPTASATKPQESPNEIQVALTVDGKIQINKVALTESAVGAIADALRNAAAGRQDPLVVINADAKTTHQRVIDIMQAAQAAGYPRISFATQAQP